MEKALILIQNGPGEAEAEFAVSSSIEYTIYVYV